MGHKEGEVIQHGMISKSIERAQKKVEENNYGTRKRLLEYDDVMNIQREAIYRKRNNALDGERMALDVYQMFDGLTEAIVVDAKQSDDFEWFRNESLSKLSMDPTIDLAQFENNSIENILAPYQEQVFTLYNRKKDHLKEILLPVVKRVFENQGHRYKRILLPYEDGSLRPLPISAHLEKGVKTEGKSITRDIEQAVTLSLIDDKWKEHLRAMDELKDSVQSASFEQKDPLVIYKMEAYNLFENLIYTINKDVVSYLMRGKIKMDQQDEIQEAKEQKTDLSNTSTNKSAEAARAAAQNAGRSRKPVETFVRQEAKVNRNDMCPCGSGKKYKHCHGK
jgi:preprotein translocase subunit SecA